jgi:hypothetical protein
MHVVFKVTGIRHFSFFYNFLTPTYLFSEFSKTFNEVIDNK